MSRREDFIAQRLRTGTTKKTKREQLSGYHSVRHNHEPPPRRKISPLLFMLLVFALIMATTTMSRSSSEAKGTVRDRTTPQWQQMLSIAAAMSDGEWGAELLDSCFLLMEQFAEAGDIEASRYMLLLASGAEPGTESKKLIGKIAENDAEAEILQLALEASHQNMLRISPGSAPLQGQA